MQQYINHQETHYNTTNVWQETDEILARGKILTAIKKKCPKKSKFFLLTKLKSTKHTQTHTHKMTNIQRAISVLATLHISNLDTRNSPICAIEENIWLLRYQSTKAADCELFLHIVS